MYCPHAIEYERPLLGSRMSGTSPVIGQFSPSIVHPFSSSSPSFFEYKSARCDAMAKLKKKSETPIRFSVGNDEYLVLELEDAIA